MIGGLGGDLPNEAVARLDGAPIPVGNRDTFLARLAEQRAALLPYIHDLYDFLREAWANPDVPFVFEGAQAVGLDPRFGVYPDVTASDPTFHGIVASTEGLVSAGQIAVRLATIKATYTSSVGTRRLPTMMEPHPGGPHPRGRARIRRDHQAPARHRHHRSALPALLRGRQRGHAPGPDPPRYRLPGGPDPGVHRLPGCPGRRDGLPPRPRSTWIAVQPQYIELPSWDGAALQDVDRARSAPGGGAALRGLRQPGAGRDAAVRHHRPRPRGADLLAAGVGRFGPKTKGRGRLSRPFSIRSSWGGALMEVGCGVGIAIPTLHPMSSIGHAARIGGHSAFPSR